MAVAEGVGYGEEDREAAADPTPPPVPPPMPGMRFVTEENGCCKDCVTVRPEVDVEMPAVGNICSCEREES